MVSKKFPFGHIIYFCRSSLFGQDGWVLVDLDLFQALLLTSTSSQSTKMQNKTKISQYPPSLIINNASASKLQGGEGGGTKSSFRSPPTPNPRACSQASESGRFIPVAFFDFYCTKQIHIVCLHVIVLS